MDTRTKIVEPIALGTLASLACAKGWFDVLTAEHCELLAGARPADGKLLVLVYSETEGRPSPLPAFDRAQMIAALECVDFVCICEAGEADALLAGLASEPALDVDACQSRDAVRHVVATQSE